VAPVGAEQGSGGDRGDRADRGPRRDRDWGGRGRDRSGRRFRDREDGGVPGGDSGSTSGSVANPPDGDSPA
jgi:hypothetical protein